MDLKSIHGVFTNRILRIPSYQRGYSWSNNQAVKAITTEGFKDVKGQIKDLWDDLMNIPDGSWHYTGLLTLARVPSQYSWLSNYEQFAIVDGQQRITTVLILLSAIIGKAKLLGIRLGVPLPAESQYLYIDAGEKAAIFGYDYDNPSDKYFRKYILQLEEVADDSKESTYTENLKKAKAFFEAAVSLYIGEDTEEAKVKLTELYTRVTSNLRFNEYVLPEELDEYVVFETMNNRGKPLSELEKLKNRLMYLNSKLPLFTPLVSDISIPIDNQDTLLEAQRTLLEDAINKAWITIYSALGAKKEHPLGDEEFIKNHWIAYFNRYSRADANAYANFLFDQHFNLQRVYAGKLNHDDIKHYVKSLQHSAEVWNKIHHPEFFEPNEATLKEAILGVHRVGLRSSFKPLLLAILLRPDNEMFINVINLLEEYSFKLFDIADRQSNTGDSKLFRLAYHVYRQNCTPDGAYNDIKGHLDYYYSFSLFKNQIAELFDTGERKGFYKWNGLRYFLFSYDKKLRVVNRITTRESEINWADFVSKNTIEHIYPQSATLSYESYCENNPTDEKRARYDIIQSNWVSFLNFTPEQRQRLCNSLGNLLALSHSDNSSYQNDPFPLKVDQTTKGEAYKNRGYKYDSMSARIVANEPDWTPTSIMQRGIKMIDFLWAKLHIGEQNLMTEEEKLEVLGISFMKKEIANAE